MSVTLEEERYLISDSKKGKEIWIGLDDRFWLKVVERKKWFRKPTWAIEMITDRRDPERFFNRDKAIEFAKHILWCWVHLIKR